MQYLKWTFSFLALALIGLGCKPNTSSGEGMAAFSKDKAFQDAHESPAPLAFSPRGTMIRFSTPDAKEGFAYAMLTRAASKKYLLLIHEWWGLNDHIKQEAERWFDDLGQQVNVLAVDMYDGKVAANAEEAAALMGQVTKVRGEAILKGAFGYGTPKAEFATLGWCFGGGWAVQAAILSHHQTKATVMYYGMPPQDASEFASLSAPILGIFAKKDKWITPQVVKAFENLIAATGRSLQVEMFDADHAFANPSNPNYNAKAADKANDLAREFVRAKLLAQE